MSRSHPELFFDGPAIVFGGPYGNLEATQALLDAAEQLDVPRSRIVCTGDVAAYGADAAATVELVCEAGIYVVMGNCEESLALGAQDCGCGYTPGSVCDRLSAAWFTHADRELGTEVRAWMAQLPRRIDVAIAGRRLAVVHGGVELINRFIFASTAAVTKTQELVLGGLDGVIAGHCGLPFTQVFQDKLWHNAGVIGMPANDGTPRVWFSRLMPQAEGLAIEHRALGYDHAAAAAKMRRAALPEGYAAALETGLWPSCDVLPSKEIRERGIPLKPGRVVWRLPAPTTAATSRRHTIGCKHLWPAVARDGLTPLPERKFAAKRPRAARRPR